MDYLIYKIISNENKDFLYVNYCIQILHDEYIKEFFFFMEDNLIILYYFTLNRFLIK